jgi:Phosphatidylethanolamine-binding protein
VSRVKWRPFVIVFAACAVVGLGIWLRHARLMGHWLQVHTGTVNALTLGIDPSLSGIPENGLTDPSPVSGLKHGKGALGHRGWAGPRPPPSHGRHSYVFQLFALDHPLDLPDKFTPRRCTPCHGRTCHRTRPARRHLRNPVTAHQQSLNRSRCPPHPRRRTHAYHSRKLMSETFQDNAPTRQSDRQAGTVISAGAGATGQPQVTATGRDRRRPLGASRAERGDCIRRPGGASDMVCDARTDAR